MELVSVIIPAYNVGEYINDCIKSVLSQTYQELEIILVDDGSSDCTSEICMQLSEQDNRIIYHKQINRGVSAARNAGLKMANGKYIIFVDADDELHSSMIEKLVYDIEKNNADISVCDIVKLSELSKKVETKNEISVELYDQDEALGLYMTKNYFEIGVWNKLFRKKILENINFAEGRRMNEDKYFVFEALMQCNRVSYRREALYFYYVRQQSATKRKFDDRWFDNQYFAQQIYHRILDDKKHLELAARTQYILTLYYLILVMKRNDAEMDYFKEYKSIVNEIKEISLEDLQINKKTKTGIVLLKRCQPLFDILKAKR